MGRIIILILAMAGLAWAEDAATPSSQSNSQSESWTEQYTIGPGDALKITLYGKPDTTRFPVPVQPDGTITYLQAQNVSVDGMTIEQVREALQSSLDRYYKNAEVIVQPVALASKHYFVLGRVVTKGAFVLDHPTSVMEAVAVAKGFETGMLEPTTAGIADLSHAFLIRDGKRAKIDFEKLFLEGDFSQNIQLQPNDYLYFPSAAAKEIYVLGAVNRPGKLDFLPGSTVIAAISASGSFNTAAFREGVVIIRGSLNNPEVISVDCNDILKGRTKDVELQPKDIVYVASRPWRIAEDLLEDAVNAFVQGMITQWTTKNIIINRKHVLPQIEEPH